MTWELTIPPDCTFQKWKKLAEEAAQRRHSAGWAMADLLAFADRHRWLEEAIAYINTLGYRRSSCINFLRTANRFPPRARKYNLTYSHYQAASNAQDADAILAQAEQGNDGTRWTVDQLEDVLHRRRIANGEPVRSRRLQPMRIHDDDPLARFIAISQATIRSIRDTARLPSRDHRAERLSRLDQVLKQLIAARDMLASTISMPIKQAFTLANTGS